MSKVGKMCKCGHPATWHKDHRLGACEYFKPCACRQFTLEVRAEPERPVNEAQLGIDFEPDATGYPH